MLIRNKIRALFLAAVVATNGWFLSDLPATDSSTVRQADILGLAGLVKTGTKTYDSLGKWDGGCRSGSPKNCLMISIPSLNMNVSDDGIAFD